MDPEASLKELQSKILNNVLLNKNELDYRESMKEIVEHYPFTSGQQQAINKEYSPPRKVSPLKEKPRLGLKGNLVAKITEKKPVNRRI